MFSSLDAAIRSLPDGAVWSTCFGYATEGGFTVIFHARGRRFSVDNGSHDALFPFTWTVREIDDRHLLDGVREGWRSVES